MLSLWWVVPWLRKFVTPCLEIFFPILSFTFLLFPLNFPYSLILSNTFINIGVTLSGLEVYFFIHSYSLLSDQSPIIVYPCHSFTHSLTDCCLEDLWCDFCLLRCQLKTSWCVADGDPEEPVDNSLVEILMMRFGRDFKPEFWSLYWSWKLVKPLRLKFGQDFMAKDWSTFPARSLVEIWKLKFDRDSGAEFWPTCVMT